jgi:hypothetical protein
MKRSPFLQSRRLRARVRRRRRRRNGAATLVVDRDGIECANADFTSIQAAVDAAQPGDLIRVWPDVYTETVVVDKALTLKGDPDAVAAIDCLQPTLGDLPVEQQHW